MLQVESEPQRRWDTLPLEYSWPLHERSVRFELGVVLNSAITDLLAPLRVGQIGDHHAGCWECDLRDNSLIWSGGVFDIFGLPRGVAISRDDVAAQYSERSRATMEALRAYAIKHRRGFTLDAEIAMGAGCYRWIRLITAPILEGETTTRLHGLKFVL